MPDANAAKPVHATPRAPAVAFRDHETAAPRRVGWDNSTVKRALVVSLAIHGVLGAALLSFELEVGTGTAHDRAAAVTIDVIAPATTPPRDVAGGGMAAAIASAATARPTPAVEPRTGRAHRATARREVVAVGDVAIDRTGPSAHASGAGTADALASGDGQGGDGGEGTGIGGNRGAGIGFGDGGRIVLADQSFVLPPAPAADVPPPSKARPAKLIYPTRQRDLGADRLFVARITVDTDGYVVGAHLVRGSNGPRDDEAADLIFRFRYLPALDDAGRAIRSTFDQPFHVGR